MIHLLLEKSNLHRSSDKLQQGLTRRVQACGTAAAVTKPPFVSFCRLFPSIQPEVQIVLAFIKKEIEEPEAA